MNEQDIADKLKDAPDAIKNCATVDKLFYNLGACELGGAIKCPFQSKKYKITQGTDKLPACERYHSQLQK
jgi:hypothetical protein